RYRLFRDRDQRVRRPEQEQLELLLIVRQPGQRVDIAIVHEREGGRQLRRAVAGFRTGGGEVERRRTNQVEAAAIENRLRNREDRREDDRGARGRAILVAAGAVEHEQAHVVRRPRDRQR